MGLGAAVAMAVGVGWLCVGLGMTVFVGWKVTAFRVAAAAALAVGVAEGVTDGDGFGGASCMGWAAGISTKGAVRPAVKVRGPLVGVAVELGLSTNTSSGPGSVAKTHPVTASAAAPAIENSVAFKWRDVQFNLPI